MLDPCLLTQLKAPINGRRIRLPSPRFKLVRTILAVSLFSFSWGQTPTNWKELVPHPLITLDGQKITSIDEWEEIRRPEILERYTNEYFGQMPKPGTYTTTSSVVDSALLNDGNTKRKTVRITITGPNGSLDFEVEIFLPLSDAPVPVILLCNHRDIITDDNIDTSYLPLPKILERGYGVAIYNMNLVGPGGGQDKAAWKDGVYSLFNLKGSEAWQNKGVWAFGGLRVVDYLATDQEIDRIAIAGQSRGGTLAMWIAALDQRISYCIANNAGHGGFVLWAFKGVGGDKQFWPNQKYQVHKQNWPDWDLGVDGNLLISLMAPRLFAGGSANKDKKLDFESQYYSFIYAQPVWKLYGLLDDNWTTEEFSLKQRVRRNGNFQYHVRNGKHDLKAWDWENYLDFAEAKWK